MLQSDTADKLEWLKEVKESHGSVEVNAMTQASNINARGIYRVGYIAKDDNQTTHKVSTGYMMHCFIELCS